MLYLCFIKQQTNQKTKAMKKLTNNLKENSDLTGLAALLLIIAICFIVPSLVYFKATIEYVATMIIFAGPFLFGAVATFIAAAKN